MSKKQIIKIIIDMSMTALFPFIMAYMITGQEVHEWLGAAMLLLFIVHHILNFKWINKCFIDT